MNDIIHRPSGRANQDYDVRQSMHPDHRDVYDLIEDYVRQQIDDVLDETKAAAQQEPQKIKQLETKTLSAFPELSFYEDQWPLKHLIAQRLSERRSYYNHRRRERKPSRRTSTLSSSSRSSSLGSLSPGQASCRASTAFPSSLSPLSMDEVNIPRCESPPSFPEKLSLPSTMAQVDSVSAPCSMAVDHETVLVCPIPRRSQWFSIQGTQRDEASVVPGTLPYMTSSSVSGPCAATGSWFPETYVPRVSSEDTSDSYMLPPHGETPVYCYEAPRDSATPPPRIVDTQGDIGMDLVPNTSPLVVDDYSRFLGPPSARPVDYEPPGRDINTSKAVASHRVRYPLRISPATCADPNMFRGAWNPSHDTRTDMYGCAVPSLTFLDAWTVYQYYYKTTSAF